MFARKMFHSRRLFKNEFLHNNFFINKVNNNLVIAISTFLFVNISIADGFQEFCPYSAAEANDKSPACPNFDSFIEKYLYVQKMPGLLHDVATPYKKATFGMGCFWASDALYGARLGVLRTRVGYSGGTTTDVRYRNIGDHTEVIEIDYDQKTVSYEELLELFWNNHEYGLLKKQKTQYKSLILYHDEEQKKIAEDSMAKEAKKHKDPLRTELAPAAKFYPAEDYHQKYRLQEHTYLVNAMGLTADQLQTSHVAARLNGYVIGLGGIDQFNKEVEQLGINEKMADYVRALLKKYKGGNLSC